MFNADSTRSFLLWTVILYQMCITEIKLDKSGTAFQFLMESPGQRLAAQAFIFPMGKTKPQCFKEVKSKFKHRG